MSLLILMAGLIVALSGLGTGHIWWVAAGTLVVGIQVGRTTERIIWAVRLVRQRMRSTMNQVREQMIELVGVTTLMAVITVALVIIGNTRH
jgi:hypothetical protein